MYMIVCLVVIMLVCLVIVSLVVVMLVYLVVPYIITHYHQYITINIVMKIHNLIVLNQILK